MNKVFRGLLGIIASLPATYIAFFIIGWFCTLVVLFFVEGPPFGYFYYHRMVLWRLFLTSLIAAAVLIVAAMIHVMVTNRLDAEAKGVWLLILFIGNIVILPLYWYLNVWRETRFNLAGAAQQIVGRERRERVSHHDWSGDA
jgi:hypothetical protein